MKMTTTLNLTEVITVFIIQLAGIIAALVAQRKKVDKVETEVKEVEVKSEEHIAKTKEELHSEIIGLRGKIIENELEIQSNRKQLEAMEARYAKAVFANELKSKQIAELNEQITELKNKLETVMIRRTKDVKVPIERRKTKT